MMTLKEKFMSEGQKNGYEAEVLEKIWADWEKFASYAFNKSHATCYTWVAYQTAYLKAHFPAEYMAGVLSRNIGAADKLKKIMDECIRMGVNVKGPDINESEEKFSVNKKGEIRFGLGAVKGVGVNAVNAIIKERENGAFKDIYDFVERVNLSSCNRSAIENLAMAGAFDSMGYPREAFVEPVYDTNFTDVLVKFGQTMQNDKNSLQSSLFGELEPIETPKPEFPDIQPWNRLKLLEEEKKLVTVYLSAHPLDNYYMEVTYGCGITCNDFEEMKEAGNVYTLGGIVTATDMGSTQKGTPWFSFKIEDFTGSHPFRVFGRDVPLYKNKVQLNDFIKIRVRVTPAKYKLGALDINVEDVQYLQDIAATTANAVRIYLDRNFNQPEFYNELMKFDAKNRPGDLYLKIFDRERNQIINIHSRQKFPITKEFIEFLDRWGIKYDVISKN